MKQPSIYILASKQYGTLYIGVTSYLQKRVYEHKQSLIDGFSKRYNCKILIYYEVYETMEAAIQREKRLKGSSRKRKVALIETLNPEWCDLYDTLA